MLSIWQQETMLPQFDPLFGQAAADTVIIGGGIAGLLTGYELSRRGISNVILERGRIASGMTGGTTAKVTLQHGLIYQRILENFGRVQAETYARVNREALDRLEEIIRTEGIGCGWKRCDAYLYSRQDPAPLERETRAAQLIGIPAELVKETELPFAVAAALRFPDQGQFHPLEFLRGILEDLRIYENSPVLKLTDDGVQTGEGRVAARNIVVATHYPFLNTPGYFFLRMHQERSYVLALKGPASLSGMYLGIEENGLSLRSAGEYLLLGGAGHRTGENREGGSYAALRAAAAEYWPKSEEAAAWSAQDCMTVDGLPYIGRYSEKTPNLYVATGFNKWGMTTSMAAATLLSAMIAGERGSEPVFSPQRLNAGAGGSLWREGIKAARGLLAGPLDRTKKSLELLQKGHGGLVELDGRKLGAYRTQTDEYFLVSPKCPHMGCQLAWNPEEKTWDCPCHGSRFRYDGTLLSGPAQEGLQRF